ncbi:hypothetical protein EVAR_39112_1 [Eumeta japonica]|uniref:Uncharacterized protein n=1 Tax=Eumeta variegata TaxID=151549 RepID=A0A4C1X5J7_EUMVA|nr:hypothetical protein EVAR_39112_1 [Eumeta japonica]
MAENLRLSTKGITGPGAFSKTPPPHLTRLSEFRTNLRARNSVMAAARASRRRRALSDIGFVNYNFKWR